MIENELLKRIETLESIEEIKKIQATYVNCLTRIDWDGIVECFTGNARVDFVKSQVSGKAAIEKFFKEGISIRHVGLEGNFVVHPIITVDGNKAKGSWMYYMMAAHDRPPTLNPPADWMQGFYDNEYEKENGKWKISLLKYRLRMYSARV